MLQTFLDGFVEGLLLALVGLAFWLPYVGARVFHLALGASFILAPFIAKTVLSAGGGMVAGVVAGLAVGSLLSGTCELWNHRQLRRRGSTWVAHLVSSLGIYIVVTQAIALIWGNEFQALASSGGRVRLGNAILGQAQLISTATVLVCLVLFYFWLFRGHVGLRLRALADSPVELELLGYDTARLRFTVFCVSGLGASAFALTLAVDRGFDASGGLGPVFLGFAAVVVGGRESAFGPLLGGLLLGLARSFTAVEFGSRWVEPATYTILATFLLFRPAGILARRRRLEVE